ncbi:uncharacterized protein LOC127252395 [Andrographis paniculata]|uniref:uncharacterized protein LOC127252395 n=1 Tax=Andrographis paniculata TaxID=175694 RepID=UPI0021E8DBC6|nr:uncharacterized protein LOC127252395 [Andrographis paniculata]
MTSEGSNLTNMNEGNNDGVNEGKHHRKCKRCPSVDVISAFDARLERVEDFLGRNSERIDEVDQRLDEVEKEMREDLTKSLAEGLEQCRDGTKEVTRSLGAEMAKLKEEVAVCRLELARREEAAMVEPSVMQEELATLRAAIAELQARGMTRGVAAAPRVEVPRPEYYLEVRRGRVIDMFIFDMERYFNAVGVVGDAAKVHTGSCFLKDSALIWWRRRSELAQNGEAITMWAMFKSELKAEFELMRAETEARAKIRWLTHREGNLREYIDEYANLLLEIPSMTLEEALFRFTEGLRPWAKERVVDKCPETVNEAMKYASRLIEFQRREPYRRDDGWRMTSDKSGGDTSRSAPRPDKSGGDALRFAPQLERERQAPRAAMRDFFKPGSRYEGCFVCQSKEHFARDCPNRSNIAAVTEDTNPIEERVACMKAEGDGVKHQGRMYMNVDINGRSYLCLLDPGANANYMSKEIAHELGLQWVSTEGRFKGVNSAWTRLTGVAKDVPIQVGDWKGMVNFNVAPIDDYLVFFGMRFVEQTKLAMIPHKDKYTIMDGSMPCDITVYREKELTPKQLERGLRKEDPTFAAIFSNENLLGYEVEEAITLLKEFKDVMPKVLPKGLPPRQAVDPAIDLVESAKRVSRLPQRALLDETIELEKQIGKPLEAKFIVPSKSSLGTPVFFQLEKDKSLLKCNNHGMQNKVTIQEGDELKTEITTRWSVVDHVGHLRNVLRVIQENQLYVRRGFEIDEVGISGYIVADGRIQVESGKVKTVIEWEVPKSTMEKDESTEKNPFEIMPGFQPMTSRDLVSTYKGPSPWVFHFAKGWPSRAKVMRLYSERSQRCKKGDRKRGFQISKERLTVGTILSTWAYTRSAQRVNETI